MAKKVQVDKPKFSLNGYEVSFDTIRNAAFGVTSGAMVLGLLSIAVAPIPLLSCGILAAWSGYSIKKKKDDDLKMEKNSYLSQLLNSMSLTTANVQKKIAHIISEVEMSLNSSIRKAVTDALISRRVVDKTVADFQSQSFGIHQATHNNLPVKLFLKITLWLQ